MSTADWPPFLRRVLIVDAATCTAMGLLLTLMPDFVGRITQIPETLLFYAGLALFPIAAYMLAIARGLLVHPAAGWSVVLGNGLWIAGSLALVLGLIAPNALGQAFILGQALAVAVLTGLEIAGLRQMHGALRTADPN